MGSLWDDDDEAKPVETNPLVDFADTQLIDDGDDSQPLTPFDECQPLSPELPDEKANFGNNHELLQDTVPFDDTVPLEDAWETQVLNLAGETQELNLGGDTQVLNFSLENQVMDFGAETQVMDCDETQVMDLGNETQVIYLGDETQVLDDINYTELMETQLLEFGDEVVSDTDGEESDTTEVLDGKEALTDDESVRRVPGQLEDEMKIQCTPCEDSVKGLMKQANHMNDEQPNAGFAPVNGGSLELNPGSVHMQLTSVRAASLQASGVAARSTASKSTSSESCSVPSNNQSLEQLSGEDDTVSLFWVSTNDGEEVNQEHDLGRCNEKANRPRDEDKCTVGSSTARKLFTEDSVAENKGFPHDRDTVEEGEDLLEFSSCSLAGLNYIDSQEPGELSQTNALDFVDKFLQDNVEEFDKQVLRGKGAIENSKFVSSAKGPQTLAKKASDKSIVQDVGIFDWDGSREDEGGGDFFRRRKADFFGDRHHGWRSLPRPQNSKVKRQEEQKDRKIKLQGKNTKKGIIQSDSKLLLHNSKFDKQTAPGKEMKLIKNLTSEFDEQFNTDSPTEQLDANVNTNNAPQMQGVGFDTQMAAEAIEALCYGEGISNCDACNAHQVVQGNPSSSPEGLMGEIEKNTISSEKPTSRKRAFVSDAGVTSRETRQAKKLRVATESSKRSSISFQEHPKNSRKKCESHFRKGKSNSVTIDLSREGSIKKHLQRDVSKFSPIAHRTRHSMVVDQLKNTGKASSDRGQESSYQTEDAATREEIIRLRDDQPSAVVSEKSSKLGSNQAGEVRNIKPSELECSDLKFDTVSNGVKSDALSFPKRRRSQRNRSRQVYGSDKLVSPSAQSDKVVKHVSRNKRLSSGANPSSAAKMGDESPRNNCKPSDSACTTPVNSKMPVNAVSPICMGNEYFTQSCKRSLSGPTLLKEIRGLMENGDKQTSTPKDVRKRRDITDVRVLYSQHLDEVIIKQQQKISARLGVSVASSMTDATHFIADQFVRTRNMLEAIASGKPVVTHLWLKSCGQASCFIDEKNYILRDTKKEKEFGFSMPASLARACQRPLLEDLKVFITPTTKPGRELILTLVKAVKGQAVERIGRSALKDDKVDDNLLVLSCEEDYEICVPLLEKGAAVYSSELLLNGIVTQKLEFERHRLFTDKVKKTRSTIWLKKDSNKFLPVTKDK